MVWLPILMKILEKLLYKLEELDIKENTIVIFLTDNGPQQTRICFKS